MLLMERGKHIFEIDLTPTVILTFFKGGVNSPVAAVTCMILLHGMTFENPSTISLQI